MAIKSQNLLWNYACGHGKSCCSINICNSLFQLEFNLTYWSLHVSVCFWPGSQKIEFFLFTEKLLNHQTFNAWFQNFTANCYCFYSISWLHFDIDDAYTFFFISVTNGTSFLPIKIETNGKQLGIVMFHCLE